MAALKLSNEINRALRDSGPVVALESTIISHGLPFPRNLEVALALEAAVRKAGAVPATIAVIGGSISVGLDQGQLEMLAAPGSPVEKTSRRDLPRVIQGGTHGATTVAATMMLAEKTGIKVFATGGIGGVHRGGGASFDISADLQELARTDVCTVCAGPKAILDLPLTMEYLETFGVPVLGYRTGELPAFWSRDSGIGGLESCASAGEIAEFLEIKWSLPVGGGVLVANPIPEAHAIPHAEVQSWINEAAERIEAEDVRGKDVTPFMLEHINSASGGRSIEANIALAENNAGLAAEIAVALCERG